MIKKLNPEEFAQIAQRPLGKKHPVRVAIEQLLPNEAILIPRADFKWRKKSPNYFCLQISKNSNKRFATNSLADDSGWTVQRVDEGGA